MSKLRKSNESDIEPIIGEIKHTSLVILCFAPIYKSMRKLIKEIHG